MLPSSLCFSHLISQCDRHSRQNLFSFGIILILWVHKKSILILIFHVLSIFNVNMNYQLYICWFNLARMCLMPDQVLIASTENTSFVHSSGVPLIIIPKCFSLVWWPSYKLLFTKLSQVISDTIPSQIWKKTNGEGRRWVWGLNPNSCSSVFWSWTSAFLRFVSSWFSLFVNMCPSLCMYLYRKHKEDTECSYPVSLVKYEPKGIKTNFIFIFILSKPWTSVVIFLMCPADKLLPNPCVHAPFLLINIAQAQL